MVLRDNSEIKWEYNEHTKVKHEILNKYIVPWIIILGKYYKRLFIFDCFAGRGKYITGEEGSPLLFIKRLENTHKYKGRPNMASCYFVEKNKENYKNLEYEISTVIQNSNKWLEVVCYQGEFSIIYREQFSYKINQYTPGFFFVDPFGFSGVSIDIIKQIMAIERNEVFITFMLRDVNRFLESPSHQDSLKELFGTNDILETLKEKPYCKLSRELAILKLYRDKLRSYANIKYTFPFKINSDNQLRTTYYLIHCTNHPKGCELMKEIMFKVGTPGRFGYFGPAEGQLSLDYYNRIDPLKKFLINKYHSKTLSFKNLRYDNLMETNYLSKDYRESILQLKKEGLVILENLGHRNGLKDDSLIAFLSQKEKVSVQSKLF